MHSMDVDLAKAELGDKLREECIDVYPLPHCSQRIYPRGSSHSDLKKNFLPKLSSDFFGTPDLCILEDYEQKFDELCDSEIFEAVSCCAGGKYRELDFCGTLHIIQYRKASTDGRLRNVLLAYEYTLKGKFSAPKLNAFGEGLRSLMSRNAFGYIYQNPISNAFITTGKKRTKPLTTDEVEALLESVKLEVFSRTFGETFTNYVAKQDQRILALREDKRQAAETGWTGEEEEKAEKEEEEEEKEN